MIVAETSRLRLRYLTVTDAPFILELLNDPEWLRFIGDKNVHSLESATAYITNGPLDMYQRLGFGLFLTELHDTHTPIGLCGLIKRDGLEHVDIGFAFLEPYRSHGYAFEACEAVLSWAARTVKLEKILAITTFDNERSGKLLQRLGLEFERMIILPNSTTELRLYAGPVAANPPLHL